MASAWILFLVIVILQNTSALFDVSNLKTCNECIRKGATWCDEIGRARCVTHTTDDICPGGTTLQLKGGHNSNNGSQAPVYAEIWLNIGSGSSPDVTVTVDRKAPLDYVILNTTQNKDIKVSTEIRRNKLTVKAKASPTFCSNTSTFEESMFVDIHYKDSNETLALIKYTVPCACTCIDNDERNSSSCNHHGDLSCGVCTCHNNWRGNTCSEQICTEGDRGDISFMCIHPAKQNEDCSGNGVCGECKTCECFDDRLGSQYFNKENYCEDICMVTAISCDDCLISGVLGQCAKCEQQIMLKYNETIVNERDSMNRTVWIPCNETIRNCDVDYVAMRDARGMVNVMVVRSCQDTAVGSFIADSGSNVGLILGVLAGVAAVMAVAGVFIYKHMNSNPHMPLAKSSFESVSPNDATVENPIYKPAISSFNNPTYGKQLL